MTRARTLWSHFEPVHSVTYFAPPVLAAFEEAGLRGFWRAYFASRAAPLGATGPEPVLATFFGFAPVMVERAFPDVWQRTTPETALRVRREATAGVLRSLAPDAAYAEAADLLDRAVAAADLGGRPLAAYNAGLPRPDDDAERLWLAATTLREHRGDGHIAVLVAQGLSPCESLVLRGAIDVPREVLQPVRGWTDEEWAAAEESLRARGWLDASGAATDAGRAAREEAERRTDELAERPWRSFSDAEVERVTELLRPVALGCLTLVPPQLPIALPRIG